ncbi:MAG: spore maturation protein [Clostridia bacterium]|nr:spore maturation protein [Clostridia bacterium]
MSYILPLLLFFLIIWALRKKVDVYSSFVEGAMESLPLLAKILPAMTAMMLALALARTTGVIDALVSLTVPLLKFLGIDETLVPMLVLRPFSGNASLALLNDVFNTSGVDSLSGVTASNMLGSTETIFYTVALYFGSVGITKTRYSIPVALISGLVGAIAAILLTPLFM